MVGKRRASSPIAPSALSVFRAVGRGGAALRAAFGRGGASRRFGGAEVGPKLPHYDHLKVTANSSDFNFEADFGA